jgi:hypothetical protein
MRNTSKIVTIPTGQTNAQLETSLNAILNQGYTLIAVLTYGTRQIAVFQKTVVL